MRRTIDRIVSASPSSLREQVSSVTKRSEESEPATKNQRRDADDDWNDPSGAPAGKARGRLLVLKFPRLLESSIHSARKRGRDGRQGIRSGEWIWRR
jgi:hypothetical protein